MKDFCRILTTFADSPADIDAARGKIVVQVHNDILEIAVRHVQGDLIVTDNEVDWPASQWLITRIARLPQLADRLISYIDDPKPFVTPSGQLVDQIEHDSSAVSTPVASAVDAMATVLGRRSAGASTILYLTSDAGEGKTTLINHLARAQAARYKAKTSDWLLVPVTLGGRTFLRFDDVVIGSLVNRLRFQFFYYDAFLELVRLGVIVPAFDGFEEVFVERSADEAFSALGTLLRSLDSSGTLLISARKAYFDFHGFEARTKLFDAISADVVSFARLSLVRWSKQNFIDYSHLRNVRHGAELYERVAIRLKESHPLLTRAVLVRRLVDVAQDAGSLDNLMFRLGNTPHDYFSQFVHAIVEREVEDKWINRAGLPAQPLLTVQQHYELLAAIAHEMWLGGAEVIRGDMLDILVDIFAETHHVSSELTHQIKERLPQHSLLTTADSQRATFRFDHEDFQQFFLGEAIGRALLTVNPADLRALMQADVIPPNTCDAAMYYAERSKGLSAAVDKLLVLSQADQQMSFVRENCGALIIRALSDSKVSLADVRDVSFPTDALLGRAISGVTFRRCYFQATSLRDSVMTNIGFDHCQFESLDCMDEATIARSHMTTCEIRSARRERDEIPTYNPQHISWLLKQAGFEVGAEMASTSTPLPEPDEETVMVEKMLRIFFRSTQLNEFALRTKFGRSWNHFDTRVLPELVRRGALEAIVYEGAGKQRRFKLGMQMRRLEAALDASRGKFADFLDHLRVDSLGGK